VHTGCWWGDLRERDHLEDLGVDGSIIFEWVFKKWGGEVWTGLMGLRMDSLRALVNAVINVWVP
jgi:hypothetical protein